MACTAESWCPIADFLPGFDGYEVSDRGRVVSSYFGARIVPGRRRMLALSRKPHQPYAFVQLGRRTFRVHLLVALAFVGPKPDGLEVRHLNGRPRDNRATNLEWSTHSINLLDQKRHGRRKPASTTKHLRKVAAIHQLRAAGHSASAIARRLRMNESTVRNIYMGRRHKNWIPAVA